jgi:hypothetical protein
MLWEFMAGCAPYQVSHSKEHGSRLVHHPRFLKFDAAVPLTYTLLAKACLSTEPRDRPSFEQIKVILADLNSEIESGSYVTSNGTRTVLISRERKNTQCFFAARLDL